MRKSRSEADLTSPTPQSRRNWIFFAVWLAFCALVFARPLKQLIQFAWQNDDASHILLVPAISAWLVFLDRKNLAAPDRLYLRGSLGLVAAAVIVGAVGGSLWAGQVNLRLTAYAAAFLLLVVSGFVAIFGTRGARQSSFALLFLIFAVPLPRAVLDRVIVQLQAGSAVVAGAIFDVCRVPALREGFVFRMPKISIEVAAECSGIRSSMALLILAVLIAHFSFRPFWKKAVFVAAGLLVMFLKNGVRIATLTILANYVDSDFLYGRLHRQGGVVFFLLGCVLLLPVYWALRRNEYRNRHAESNA